MTRIMVGALTGALLVGLALLQRRRRASAAIAAP